MDALPANPSDFERVEDAGAALAFEAKIAFLRRLAEAASPDRTTAYETHMSWVFMVGDRAFKLKKPVRLPYLDFTTLQRREAACRAELRLNRRLAPDVYLDVAPLRLGPGGLSIGGEGRTVDWLVRMRRLDDAQCLAARLHNHVRDGELDQIALALIGFYRRATRVRVTPRAHLSFWSRALDDDRRVLLDRRFDLPRGWIRWIDRVLHRFLEANADRLAERVRRRRILDAHGDLRPEHIFLGDGVRIIDCLEFSAELRANDPADEIAFLDLECERLGAPEAGSRIRRKVLRALGEADPEPLYSFYRCHRAMLRARLSIAHLFDPHVRSPDEWPARARRYLALAAADAARLEPGLRLIGKEVAQRAVMVQPSDSLSQQRAAGQDVELGPQPVVAEAECGHGVGDRDPRERRI